jgi:hypothetical protein
MAVFILVSTSVDMNQLCCGVTSVAFKMVVPTNSYAQSSIARNVDSALYDCLHSFGLQSWYYLIKLQNHQLIWCSAETCVTNPAVSWQRYIYLDMLQITSSLGRLVCIVTRLRGWTVQNLQPGKGKWFFSPTKCPDWPWGLPTSYSVGNEGLS